MDRQRRSDLSKAHSLKDERLITIFFHTSEAILKSEKTLEYFKQNSLFSDSHSDSVYAFFDYRSDCRKGFAWLPLKFLSKPEWCDLISREWAKKDNESFESFNNWDTENDWLSIKELTIKNKIDKLEKDKKKYIDSTENEISKLNK